MISFGGTFGDLTWRLGDRWSLTAGARYIRKGLAECGHVVDLCDDGTDGLHMGLTGDYDALVVDRMLPGVDGLSIVKTLRATGVRVPVLFLTALGGVDDRVSGLDAGGDDYLVKPFNPEEASLLTRRVLETREVRRENRYLKRQLSRRYELSDILSRNPRMLEVFELIKRINRHCHFRVVIDVIAGASAGAINGVMLGKAIVDDGQLEAQTPMWLADADVEYLGVICLVLFFAGHMVVDLAGWDPPPDEALETVA